MLCSVLAFAQTRTVTGVVRDDKGEPIPYATVTEAGTRNAVQADERGNFSIKVGDNARLAVSATGFNSQTITVSGNTATVSLIRGQQEQLQEVVVSTGYNTRRTQRSTVSNAQVVTADKLNTIRQTNINNALAGKVAGVQVRSQSVAALGRETNIRLRGEGGVSSGSVLYIVDGTPTNATDVNPDDIQDMSVLNGPTGAAIYGPQAANGVIVINTKRGRKSQPGIGVEVNTGVQWDQVNILPNYQNSYAGGNSSNLARFTWVTGMPEEWKSLDGKYYHDYTDDASWGPRMAGQEYIPWYAWYPGTKYTGKTASLVPQPDNARQFFAIGRTANNNIAFSKAGENFTSRISYSNLDQKGVIPETWLKRHTLAANGSVDLSNRFTIGTNINYVSQDYNSENNDAYSNPTTGSFNSWFHRDLDMKIMKELRGLRSPVTPVSSGVLASWNHSNPGSFNPNNPDAFYRGNYWSNPYAEADNISFINHRDRIYGDVNFSFKATNDIRFRAAIRKNHVTSNFENKSTFLLERSQAQSFRRSHYATGRTFLDDNRYELTGTFNKKISDFTIDYLLGGEIVKISSKALQAATRDGLYIPDFFALSNSIGPVNFADANGRVNFRENEKRRAIFTRGNIGYKNFLFGEFTLRNDWYSTLPVNDNSIFVKSFGTSFVFSDFTKEVAPWLSYGKLRASWGEVPQAINPYQLQIGYAVGADQWNNHFTMGTPNTISDAALKGAVRTTKEAGLDLRFLKNRVGISATYFDAETKNSPVTVQINGASGFTNKIVNAGLIKQNGIDLQLTAEPVQLKDFNWSVSATFSRLLDNKVVELAPGVDQITVPGAAQSSTFSTILPPTVVHQVGQQWGMLVGGGKTYNAEGKVVLDEDGHYVRTDNVKFGSVLPDYTGGIQNTFTYKDFTLNVNIDFQKGGKFMSVSDMWGSYSGLLARTAGLNDKGNPIRDAVADGGGVHVVGVDVDGKVIDKYIPAQEYFHSMAENNVFDEYIYDLTFVKLRELSLGYNVPVRKFGAVSKYVQNASVSLVARNPWLLYSKTRDFDPSEISSTFGENGQLPGTRSFGFNVRIGF
jgi:TonB-linked SusC/RagA family outer membrane protein